MTSVLTSCFRFFSRIAVSALLLVQGMCLAADEPPRVLKPYFGIHVVDAQTGRGVPLVELRTVNEIVLHTDSAGWIAFHEPGLMDREVYFHVSSPGYEYPADGFGNHGVRLTPTPGATATLKLRRVNFAERLYRITGQGIYRDSELLGVPAPAGVPPLNTGVMGQDSAQVVRYRGKLFWLWGDTSLPHYPLGNFKTTSATSPLPGPNTFQPGTCVPLNYFADSQKPDRVRTMVPTGEPGVIWLDGLMTLLDPDGNETLLAHFSRRKGLMEQLEHGLVRFDDTAGVFRKVAAFAPEETWRFPRGIAVRVEHEGQPYLYFVEHFAAIRVPADWASVLDPTRYEALAYDPKAGDYRWQHAAEPTTQADEAKRIASGGMPAEKARYQLADTATGRPVRLHRGSIRCNAFRQKWILIGNEEDFARNVSYLGEIWYAEADSLTGPWRKAVKVATHPNYSFYNPVHHEFFDEEDGRVIYFEGTYTRQFSRSPVPTPRYDYNQIMYRLDLSRVEPRVAPSAAGG